METLLINVKSCSNTLLGSNKTRILLGIFAVGVSLRGIHILLSLRRRRLCREKSKANKNVVILHQIPRARIIPSISPFPLKLETYLRMANIPYESEFQDFMGPKQKMPYITLNGEDIGDSQLIIELLNKKFNVDLNSDYSDVELAIGHAFRIMCENYLMWNLALHRWVYDKDKKIEAITVWPFPLKYFVFGMAQRIYMKSSWYHGLGRHTQEEVRDIGIKDLKAISKFLGNKPFFLGDKPCEVDCAIFGNLALFVWTLPGTVFENLIHGELSNLKDYCYRMKERFWPDWDNCLAT